MDKSTGKPLLSNGEEIRSEITFVPQMPSGEVMATRQIKLCTSGFGASPKSRDSTYFCVDLYSGKESLFEQQDVLGTLEPEQLPEWARLGLVQYRHSPQEDKEGGAR